MKKIFLIIGQSGSGKSTICESLEKKYGYKLLRSYTTRKPRYEGEEGHIFITKEKYELDKSAGRVIAHVYYDNNHYYTTRDILKQSDLYIVEKAGVEYLKKEINDIKFIVILITAEEKLRIHRMKNRGNNDEEIASRIQRDKNLFKDISYNYIIENIDLTRSIRTIKDIISMEEYRHI
ncbi:MAG: AAA family ATPase [Bacillota bacterium]|nr:AAA family ATPase [Bacillota bacterium]